jgi:hypothetical protein
VPLDLLLYTSASMLAAAPLVGTRRLGLGTDHPFRIGSPDDMIADVEQAFDGPDRAWVMAGAAREFFGLSTRANAGPGPVGPPA